METLNLLKEEINQTMESEHDFAKWKLIVVAGLGGTALGLGKAEGPHYWLLLFIPFACAYIDLHLYQYQERILVLAQFIRNYRPAKAAANGDTALQDYELYCAGLRQHQRAFDLGQRANLAASVGLSLAAMIAVAAYWRSTPISLLSKWTAVIIWAIGFVLILILKQHHGSRLDQIKLYQPTKDAEN